MIRIKIRDLHRWLGLVIPEWHNFISCILVCKMRHLHICKRSNNFFQTSIWSLSSLEKIKTWAEPELVQSWAPAGSSGRPWSVSSRETCRAASSPWTPCALERRATLTLSLVCEGSCYCHCHICVIVIGPSPSGKRAQQRGQWTGHHGILIVTVL